MNKIGAIIILVILGLFFGSMFIGIIKDAIESDEIAKEILKPILPELTEWEHKLEISGIMTLALVITAIIPINPLIKILAGFTEFSGGAIAWMFV